MINPGEPDKNQQHEMPSQLQFASKWIQMDHFKKIARKFWLYFREKKKFALYRLN